MSGNNLKDINYCPSCGSREFSRSQSASWHCKQCEFIYFQNSAAAVAAIISCHEEILLTIRKSDPGRGMLDLPGGFVNSEESLEEALTREIKEELNYPVDTWEYLFSLPNRYTYKGIVYSTTDAFFKIDLDVKPDLTAGDDVSAIVWMPVREIELSTIALDSIRRAIQRIKDTPIKISANTASNR